MYTAEGLPTFRAMTRFAPLLIAVLLALAAAGGALFGFSMGTPDAGHDARPGGSSAGSQVAAAPPVPASAGAVPSKGAPRAGRVLTLDDAIRELDLIRPSRQKAAEDFTLRTSDGGSFRLGDHRGKTVLVNFWATWCPPCLQEMPAMERLYQRHKDRGLVLVAISLDADPALVPPFVKQTKLTFPIALDPKAEVANKYGVRALPSSFVVDRAGTMTALALGPRAWDNDASHSLVEALTFDGHGPSSPKVR
jgi:peroxiredoxin